MADVPLADRRSEEKALIRLKEKLRENLKTIIRNDSVISQVVNHIFSVAPERLIDINKFFKGFKDYFIKKFGEGNEKVNYSDIVNEIDLYLIRATNPRVLSGNVINPEEIAEAITRNLPKSVVPYQPRTSPSSSFNSPFNDEFGSSPDDILESFEKMVRSTDQNLKSLRSNIPTEVSGEESEGASDIEEEKNLRVELIKKYGVNETLAITNSSGRKLYIKYYDQNVKINKKEGKMAQNKEIIAPIFFLSISGLPGSFKDISYRHLIEKIALFFGVTKSEVYQLMGKRADNKTFTKADLTDFLSSKGLLPTLSESPRILGTEPLVIGYGIKQAQDLPEKVPFGSNILFLKKLFLKNILSIQNKHNTKINGFNNVHVSDNFVKIIMNLLKGIDFTNNELQNLSNGERLLLDNLLMLSELNKKFITGSSTTSLNQLKKDYEILVGEIEAGNNNEILKKKLYNLLMKMVHFGALSQIQAIKHYKEIVKSYF